jgi:hypothetical protein
MVHKAGSHGQESVAEIKSWHGRHARVSPINVAGQVNIESIIKINRYLLKMYYLNFFK